MKKLLIVTSTERPQEYEQYWGDMQLEEFDQLEVINGYSYNGKLDKAIDRIKQMIDASDEFGILVHGVNLEQKVSSELNIEVSFVQRFGTELSGDFNIDYENQSQGLIAELLTASALDDAKKLNEAISKIWDRAIGKRVDEVIPDHFPQGRMSLDSEFARILVLANDADTRYIEKYFLNHSSDRVTIRKDRQIFESGNLESKILVNKQGVYILTDKTIYEEAIQETVVEGSEGKRTKSFQKFIGHYDLIFISANLGWISEVWDGYDLAQEIIGRCEEPITLRMISSCPISEILNDARKLKHQVVEAMPFIQLPINEHPVILPFKELKWKALRMALTTEDLFNKWIHDFKYLETQEELKSFVDRILEYEDLINSETIKRLKEIQLQNLNFVLLRSQLEEILSELSEPNSIDQIIDDVNVLLVEDNEKQNAILLESLKLYFGENVTAVRTGKEAIEELDKQFFKVLICDIELLDQSVERGRVYQDVWGVEVLEHAFNKSKGTVLCALTAMPKDHLEMLFDSNKRLKNEVTILYKDPKNSFLPVHYRWREELDALSSKINRRQQLDGPLNGKWKGGKLYRKLYETFNSRDQLALWRSIEEKLFNFQFDQSILTFRKTDDTDLNDINALESFSLLERLFIGRILIMHHYESGQKMDWNDFTEKLFNFDKGIADSTSRVSTHLGFRYSRKNEIITYDEDVFHHEKKLVQSIGQAWNKIVLDEQKYPELVSALKEIAKYFHESGFDKSLPQNLSFNIGYIEYVKRELKIENLTLDIYNEIHGTINKYINLMEDSPMDCLEWKCYQVLNTLYVGAVS